MSETGMAGCGVSYRGFVMTTGLVGMLGACANPSSRIATALTRYGFDTQQSQCVGDRLETNLSLGQLQQLGRAARSFNEGDTTPGRLTASDFMRVSARIEDPKIPIEVAKAAANCGVLSSTAIGL